MSINASNNPYPDSPDPSPSKLDKGGYDGTAETLDNKIDEILVEALLKIDGVLSDSTIINGVTEASAVPPTGNIHAIGVGPGTYTNWGGMVIPANNIGTLQRVGGVYSVSLTELDLTDYAKTVDVAEKFIDQKISPNLGINTYGSLVNEASTLPNHYTVFVDYVIPTGLLKKVSCDVASDGNITIVFAKKTGTTFQIYNQVTVPVVTGINNIDITEDVYIEADTYIGKLRDGLALIKQGVLVTHNAWYSDQDPITDATSFSIINYKNYSFSIDVETKPIQLQIENLENKANAQLVIIAENKQESLNLINGTDSITYSNLNKGNYQASGAYSYIQNIEMKAGNLDKIEFYCWTANLLKIVFATKIDATHFHIYKTIEVFPKSGFNVIDLSGHSITDGTYFGLQHQSANGELYKIDGEGTYFAVSGIMSDVTAMTSYNSKLAYKIYMQVDGFDKKINDKDLFFNQAINKNGLVAYFRFDKDVVSSFDGNYIGNKVGGISTLQPKLTNCKSDTSVYFDGDTGTYIDFGVKDQFNFNLTDKFCIEFLIKPTATEGGNIFHNLGTTGWNIYIEKAGKKNILVATLTDSNGGVITMKSTTSLPTNAVSHVSVSFYPIGLGLGTLELPYVIVKINGIEQIEGLGSSNLRTPLTGSLSSGASSLILGADFKGYIDELVVYNIMPKEVDLQKRVELSVGSGKPIRPKLDYVFGNENVILDIDIDGDSDDLGDVHIAKVLQEQGEINLLGIVTSTRQTYSAPATKAILDWWGDSTTPVYAYQGTDGVDFGNAGPAWAVRNQFRPTDVRTNYTNDLIGYRTMLENAEDNSVTIVTTGFLISIKRLMESPADGISTLTGLELIEKKVKCLMVVGNFFPQAVDGFHEYNAVSDPTSWKYVIENWKKDIIFSGGEIGMFITSKPTVKTVDDYLTNPVRFGYKHHRGDAANYTWGQLLLILVARGYGEDRFVLSQPFTQEINPANGDNYPAKFTNKGNRWYLRLGESFVNKQKLQKEMDELFVVEP